MKYIFPIVWVILFAGITQIKAQSAFYLNPSPSNVNAPQTVSDTAAETVIGNLTSDTVFIKWERTVINITQGCWTQVCDPIYCYSAIVSTKTFFLKAGETKPMTVHFMNDGEQFCCALVHIKLTNQDNLNDTITGIYLLNDNCAVGTEDLARADIRFFPNPVTENFSIDNAEMVSRIRVFSLEGRQVAVFEASQKGSYSLTGQPAGMYILALEDKNGKIFRAMELRKN